jgi:hypothetical protein
MFSITSLDISGYRSEPVPNTFIRQDHETQHLAMLFPGYGYRATMPALYYPERLLAARGADVLRLEYAYDRRADFRALPEAERDLWFFTDMEAACDTGLAQRAYGQITLVGKSIGTLAMGHLVTTDARLQQAQCIWLTPLLRNDQLRAQIKRGKQRALFVIGAADGHYDPRYLAEVERATNGQSVVVEKAGHSLEIPGDVVQSLRALEQIMQKMISFLG